MVGELTDKQWEHLAPLIPYGGEPYGRTGQCGRNTNNRRCINPLIWLAHSGGVGATYLLAMAPKEQSRTLLFED